MRRIFFLGIFLPALAWGCAAAFDGAANDGGVQRALARLEAALGRGGIVGVRVLVRGKLRTRRGRIEAVRGTTATTIVFDFRDEETGEVRSLSFLEPSGRPRVVVN